MPLAADNSAQRTQGSHRANSLDSLFAPKRIAIIGASEQQNSVGRAVVENLALFPGEVFLVNPNHDTLFGRRSFANLAEIPDHPDLAVIATPAAAVPQIIRDSIEAEIPAAVILSAGFRECGAAGRQLETQILSGARSSGMRIVGPNCLGVMTPRLKMNATFANEIAEPGSVAFLSQSGALCAAVLDWSLREKIGFSGFVSVGSMMDVGWGDLIDYFGDDPHTKSIVCYMESIGDARSFMSAAREVAVVKPIIVLKVGHTEAGAKAASSHTGALTGSDAVIDAAFRRAGVLRVNTLDEMFDLGETLGKQPRLHGPRLAIVTNAGGPGALASDMLLTSGGKLARLSEETVKSLNRVLPPYWSHSNPVDILGDADAPRFRQAIDIVAADPEVDGVLTILTPQAMTDPTAVASEVRECAQTTHKPFLASWMGGASVAEGEAMLNAAHVPTFPSPDEAARAFALMWQYSDNLRALYETPHYSPLANRATALNVAEKLIASARGENRTLLNQSEAATILTAYGIPVIQTRIATTEEQAVAEARSLLFPVAVKLHSKLVTHKSDVGGVFLNVADEDHLRVAWRAIRKNATERAGPDAFDGVIVQPMLKLPGIELILGSSIDPQFGPTILFGTGGKFVEIYNDTAIALTPLNASLARRLIERTRVSRALNGVRDIGSVNTSDLENIIASFSQLVVEQSVITEIDINPLLANSAGIIAVDCRMILHPASVTKADVPRPAIRPYPAEYVQRASLKDGTPIVVRPIRPEDEALMTEFHQTLSDRSVYMRYFTPFKLEQRIAHTRLSRVCLVDYDREMALVAEHSASNGQRHIVGIARLSRRGCASTAEFSLLVSDEWQGQGLGTELLRRLVAVALDSQVARIFGMILRENSAMQRVASKLGFTLRDGDDEYVAELLL